MIPAASLSAVCVQVLMLSISWGGSSHSCDISAGRYHYPQLMDEET